MKKLLFALAFTFVATISFAQSTAPRFGTAPNQDNTGRVLTYRYFSVTDAVGADSIALTPRAWQTIIPVTLVDSFTFKQIVVSQSFAGDNIRIVASGASGTKVKFSGNNWISTGTATLSTGGHAIIEFEFDGAKWVESNRTVQ